MVMVSRMIVLLGIVSILSTHGIPWYHYKERIPPLYTPHDPIITPLMGGI